MQEHKDDLPKEQGEDKPQNGGKLKTQQSAQNADKSVQASNEKSDAAQSSIENSAAVQNSDKSSDAAQNAETDFFSEQVAPQERVIKQRKYSRSFQIALAGISCGVATAALILGYYVGFLLASGFIIAEIALMVPLSKQFIWADALAYVATVVIAMLIGGLVGRWWEFIPFVMFFGLHPLANCLQIKFKINKWIALAIKIVWFDAMLFLTYYALGGLMGLQNSKIWQTLDNYVWIIILIAGSLFLWVYDMIMFRMQIWINRLVFKIKR